MKGAVAAAQFGLAATVGAPVYAPRAAAAAKTALAARKTRLTTKLHTATANASAFGHEYATNVAPAGRAEGW